MALLCVFPCNLCASAAFSGATVDGEEIASGIGSLCGVQSSVMRSQYVSFSQRFLMFVD